MTSEDEQPCTSQREVQLGPLCATTVRCMLKRWEHVEPLHFSARTFGDVEMQARWRGAFEP